MTASQEIRLIGMIILAPHISHSFAIIAVAILLCIEVGLYLLGERT